MVKNCSLVIVDMTAKGLLWFKFKDSKTVFQLSPMGKLQVKWNNLDEKKTLYKLVKNLLVAIPNEKLVIKPLKQQMWIEYPVPDSFKVFWCDEATEFVHKEIETKEEEKKPDEFHWVSNTGGFCAFEVGGHEVLYPPSRTILELAAWIKHNPEGWNIEDIKVKNAKLCLEHTSYFIPAVEETSEDPDGYAFVWPKESLKEIKLGSTSFSRFFDYKAVYDAVQVANVNSRGNGAVFLGAFCSKSGDDPLSVIVAVRKEGTLLEVVQVERRLGKLDKAWVKGASNHLKAKNEFVLSQEKLKDSVKREVLLTLRDTFDKHVLSIPSRYTQLVEELFDFSYGGPASGYVLALALAVQRAAGS